MAVEEDLRRPRADMATRCELPYDLRLIDEVSTGAVMVMRLSDNPVVYSAKVDASAGGSMAASSRPYVYLDLVRAAKVDLTDVQARDSTAWDIALKRYQIKINSGDSGPGGVTAAVVRGKELSEVTMAPAQGYVEDDYIDENCNVFMDAIGGLATALSDWYSYQNMQLSPHKDTFVLKRRDGMGFIKLQILSYYDMGRSGVYTLRWGFLP